MTSKIKVDNIENQCGGAVVTKCGATTTISGSVVKADDIQAADGGNLINQCGTTITLGASGDTINLASGASQSGFGRTGTVDWDTTAITADPNPAVSGTGYFVNTTSGAITITLPTSPAAGDIVAFADYALTWDTNSLILDPGSNKINGSTDDYTVSSEGKSLTLVYTDSTQGWKVVNDGNSNAGSQVTFITATGGTETTCGDYKIHTFTGPGTFTVTCAGNQPTYQKVDYLVVAGGGGGGHNASFSGTTGGAGGAGGFRESHCSTTSGCYTASPLASSSSIPVTAQGYPIVVGGGGAGANNPGPANENGTKGADSSFSTITSTGGGFGGASEPGGSGQGAGGPGGSGGGGSYGPGSPGGTGNTPSVSPPQGNNGGSGGDPAGASGGGAGGAAANACGGTVGAAGVGAGTEIHPNSPSPVGTPGPTGPLRYFSGGGGGGADTGSGNPPGGYGGGGSGGEVGGTAATDGTTNTGGGGGGGDADDGPSGAGGSGGSGIVIIRYKFQ